MCQQDLQHYRKQRSHFEQASQVLTKAVIQGISAEEQARWPTLGLSLEELYVLTVKAAAFPSHWGSVG